MDDVQAYKDDRGIKLDRAGVSDLLFPITVLDRQHQQQQTTASLELSVSVAPDAKGTHMSRFVELLNAHRGEFTMRTLPTILRDLKHRLEAESARIEASFTYFIDRKAPVSGAVAPMDYTCRFVGSADGDKEDFILGVTVPVTSLCPCSKAISDYGAHNQRGEITIEIRSGTTDDGKPEIVWIEELIDLAEQCGSAPVYPLLKRADERFVTMQAYDNPVFVEDMVRNAAQHLNADQRVTWFRVRAVNHESIHNHSAFAEVEIRK